MNYIKPNPINPLILVVSLFLFINTSAKGQVVDSLSQSYSNGNLSIYLNIIDVSGFNISGVSYQKVNDTLIIDVCILNHVTSNLHSEDVTLQIAMFLKPNHYIVNLHNGINCTNLISSQYYPPNITTGIDEKNINSSINLYPNPTTNIINLSIENNLKISTITLYDIAGRVARIYNPSEKKLKTEGLSNGQYFLKIETEEGVITKRVQLE